MESSTGIAFLDFDEKDRKLLLEAYIYIRPKFAEILDEFYDSLATLDAAPENYGANRAKLKKYQQEHWRHLFQGTFDTSYENTARRIAIRHMEIGLPQDLYILSYLKILTLFSGVICGVPGIERRDAARMVDAVAKAIAIDMMHAITPYTSEVV